jgi:hypothetical protein
MAFSLFLIVTLVIILLIWLFIEVKRARHKVFAVALILVMIFLYFSVTYVFQGKNVDYKSVSGISDATKIYFNWLGYFYGNVKTVTMNTIRMDWGGNVTQITNPVNKSK